ncbi:radical SAM protein [Thermodesulfobacteriota bacterium]
MKFKIEQVWVEDEALDDPVTRDILGKVGDARVVSGSDLIQAKQRLSLAPDPLKLGKRILRLLRHKGTFVRPCPGTREYICCGLKILHIGQGCPMDCRYCALQAYFNRPVLELFVNTEDLLAELQVHLESSPEEFHRICTGEFTDSLALDYLTGLAPRLVRLFSEFGNGRLEIKTKTDSIDRLLEVDPRGGTVLSFSVNAPVTARREDRLAAPLERRLHAAGRAANHGYRIGFHFDPIIPLPGWEEGYFATVDSIFREVDAAAISWISLGVLRFVPELKDIVASRFGPVPYFHDGFLRGLDGKSRLQVERRIEVYRSMVRRIRSYDTDATIYFCMESPYVWEKSLGITMKSDGDLIAYLDRAARC